MDADNTQNDTAQMESPARTPEQGPAQLVQLMRFSGADLAFLVNSNTFRLGDKYASLRPGDLVQPVDKEDQPEGKPLAVKAVHVMEFGHALQEHAMRNHGIREENAKRRAVALDKLVGEHKAAGPDYLRAILNKHYVAADFTDDSLIVTVIEFADFAE